MRVQLLGPVSVDMDGVCRPVPGLRRRAVLAVLALHRGAVVSTDRLIDVVWGPAAPSVAVNTLQSHVSHLRQLLGGRSTITARPPGYLLDLAPGSVDVEVAEGLIEQALQATDLEERARLAQRALGLWRGPPLSDVAGVAWLEEQAQRLDELRLRAIHTSLETRLGLGQHASLVPDLERLARDHPLNERIQGQLILALYRTGRQADALAAYHRLRHTLDEELGIHPSQALRELEAAILRQDPGLHAPTGRLARREPADRASPGNLRLGESELVGRDGELAMLRDIVDAASAGAGGAVFIVGEPGIGKTRLASEIARYAGGMGLTVLRGRAGTPAVQFRPLGEALLSVLRRSGPPDDPGLLPYRPALSRLVPEWRGEHPAGADDSLVVLAEAILRLAVALGRPKGCVLVLEDLHDADADTLAVVDYLADNAGGEPLLLVGTVRADPSPALRLLRAAQHRRTASAVELARLDDEAVRRLAGACLGVPADEVPAPVAEQLLVSADGVPLHVEEMLAGLVGERLLVRSAGRWALAGPVSPRVPTSLATTLVGRVERLGTPAGSVLRAATLLGRRFPAAVAGVAAGVDPLTLLGCLREAVDAQLLVPQEDPGWYAFRHALTAEALAARLLPLERAGLARRAAVALDGATATGPDGATDTAFDVPAQTVPDPPFHGAEQLAGELWQLAGEPARAAERFGAAGRRAAAQGAVSTAIMLLERALAPVRQTAADGVASAAADGVASNVTDGAASDVVLALLNAYADAGRVGDAYALGVRFANEVAPECRADVHLHLARVAAAAGDWRHGRDELAEARLLLGSGAGPDVEARLDAVEAQLVFGDPSVPARLREAWRLAERALRNAQATGQPDVACNALETLGRRARLRDLAEADGLYERGLALATANNLLTWKMCMLYHLGADHGIRYADTDRLAQALAVANEAGAVVTALDIELEISVVRLCRGEFEAAEAATRACEDTAARLRLTHTRLIALGERVMVAAHLGRPSEVETLLDRFRELGGEQDDFSSAVRGFGLAFCHLLHEDTEAALAQTSAAWAQESRRPTSYLSFVPGPHLFLSVLAGRSGAAECAALAGSPQLQARWNCQFLALSEALVHGRSGRTGEAERRMARFLELSAPYPLARHLGLRLVAPDAIEGGWGDPVSWLRTADAYFHGSAERVARACRALLRRTGAAVPQHRRGSDALPAAVRRLGITVREYEVLGLVAERLNNPEIGRRLFLSPRTVEKHVAGLLAKTGAADRAGLVAFAAGVDDPTPAR